MIPENSLRLAPVSFSCFFPPQIHEMSEVQIVFSSLKHLKTIENPTLNHRLVWKTSAPHCARASRGCAVYPWRSAHHGRRGSLPQCPLGAGIVSSQNPRRYPLGNMQKTMLNYQRVIFNGICHFHMERTWDNHKIWEMWNMMDIFILIPMSFMVFS